ncbi:MAG: response regulator [Brevinematales bacterium]|jgi:DNA-binding NtrC family response regulator
MKILIVADDRDALKDFSISLKPTGFEIVETDNPKTALDLYIKQGFELVILDVSVQDKWEIKLLSELQELNPKVRVVIVSAYWDLEKVNSAINNHAAALFEKPFNFKKLVDTIISIELEIKNLNYIKMNFKQLDKEIEKLWKAYDDWKRLNNKFRLLKDNYLKPNYK